MSPSPPPPSSNSLARSAPAALTSSPTGTSALADEVRLLALTIDERAIILGRLEDPPDGLAEFGAVLLSEHQWRQWKGLEP